MRRFVCRAVSLGMVALTPLLAACVPAALMVDRAVEARAEDSRLFPASLDRVWSATLAALRQLKMQVTKNVRDNLGGDIDGVSAGGDTVTVRLEASGEGQTRVRVRVGGMRDRDATDLIFAKITDNL